MKMQAPETYHRPLDPSRSDLDGVLFFVSRRIINTDILRFNIRRSKAFLILPKYNVFRRSRTLLSGYKAIIVRVYVNVQISGARNL